MAETGNRGPIARPVLLAVLIGASFLLSIIFLASPEAFSGKTARPAAAGPEAEALRAQAVAPVVKRYDFRVTGETTFYGIMSLFDVPGAAIQKIARKARPHYNLSLLRKGTVFKVFTADGAWERIEYKFSDFDVLRIRRRTGSDVEVSVEELPSETREVSVAGVIHNSLYEDGLRAGADAQAIMNLSDIFAWDIDFATDLRKGDTFSLVYEVLYVDGRPVRDGRILGAEMVNSGRRYTAIYFVGDRGDRGYFNVKGRSLTRTLLKSPLRYRRISSYFTTRRYHPILKKFRAHHGIDYAAPVGTPVEAAGSGTVIFAGWKKDYGNFIKIRHNNSYVTAYGHLSKIRRGIRKWAKVNQGDVIGYVGSTGLSTGPHLHYEVRIRNKLVNPLRLKSAPNRSLTKAEMARFASVREAMLARLEEPSAALAARAPDRPTPRM